MKFTRKAELKALAAEIHSKRKQFKDAQRSGSSIWKILSSLNDDIFHYRHKHIAATSIEKVETLPKAGRCESRCTCCNKPDMEYVHELMEKWKNEAQGSGQVGSQLESESSPGGSCGSGVVLAESQEPLEQNSGLPQNGPTDAQAAPVSVGFFRSFLRARFG